MKSAIRDNIHHAPIEDRLHNIEGRVERKTSVKTRLRASSWLATGVGLRVPSNFDLHLSSAGNRMTHSVEGPDLTLEVECGIIICTRVQRLLI